MVLIQEVSVRPFYIKFVISHRKNKPFFDKVFIDFSIVLIYNNKDMQIYMQNNEKEQSARFMQSAVLKTANKKRRFGASFTIENKFGTKR